MELKLQHIQKRRKNGTFAKGNIPYNKGVKMSEQQREKLKHSWYQKGNLPHNTKHDGCIVWRERPTRKNEDYYFIRIELNKWELYHRYLWKKNYGEIPKGMIIIFKDNDHRNCTIENLKMISRAENVRRNYNRKKASDTLKKLWKRERIREIYGMQRLTKLRL